MTAGQMYKVLYTTALGCKIFWCLSLCDQLQHSWIKGKTLKKNIYSLSEYKSMFQAWKLVRIANNLSSWRGKIYIFFALCVSNIKYLFLSNNFSARTWNYLYIHVTFLFTPCIDSGNFPYLFDYSLSQINLQNGK